MDAKRSGYQQRGPQIRLELVGPNENNDVTAVAKVSFGDNPAEDISVEFFHSKMDEPDAVEVTKEGRAVMDFLSLKPGAHTFEVRVLGSMKGDRKSIRIEAPKQKDASEIAKFIVEPYRVENRVYINAHVIGADGHGVKGAKISAFDSTGLEGKKDQHTADEVCDGDGRYSYSFKMEENEEREIGFSVKGSDIKSYRQTWRWREVPEDDEENIQEILETAATRVSLLERISQLDKRRFRILALFIGAVVLALAGVLFLLGMYFSFEVLFWFFAICGATLLLYYGAHQLQRYNNRILLGLAALTVALTITAVIRGGGEPALTGILTEPSAPVHVTNQYIDPKIFADDMPIAHETGTWFWWELQIYVLITTILFIPVSFSDEIKNQISKLSDMWEQRRRVFTKEKEAFEVRPIPPREPGVQPAEEKKKTGFLEKFFSEVTRHWESAVFYDVVFDLAKKIF